MEVVDTNYDEDFPQYFHSILRSDQDPEVHSIIQRTQACDECKVLYTDMMLQLIKSPPCQTPIDFVPQSCFNADPAHRELLIQEMMYFERVLNRMMRLETEPDIEDHIFNFQAQIDEYSQRLETFKDEAFEATRNQKYCLLNDLRTNLEQMREEMMNSQLYREACEHFLLRDLDNRDEKFTFNKYDKEFYDRQFKDIIDNQNRETQEKNVVIEELKAIIQDRDEEIRNKNSTIDEREATIHEREATIGEMQTKIEEKILQLKKRIHSLRIKE